MIPSVPVPDFGIPPFFFKVDAHTPGWDKEHPDNYRGRYQKRQCTVCKCLDGYTNACCPFYEGQGDVRMPYEFYRFWNSRLILANQMLVLCTACCRNRRKMIKNQRGRPVYRHKLCSTCLKRLRDQMDVHPDAPKEASPNTLEICIDCVSGKARHPEGPEDLWEVNLCRACVGNVARRWNVVDVGPVKLDKCYKRYVKRRKEISARLKAGETYEDIRKSGGGFDNVPSPSSTATLEAIIIHGITCMQVSDVKNGKVIECEKHPLPP